MDRLQATLQELKEFKKQHIVDNDPYQEEHYIPSVHTELDDDRYPWWAVALFWITALVAGGLAWIEAFHLFQ